MRVAKFLRSIFPPGVVSCWLPGSRASGAAYQPGTEVITDGGLEAWTDATHPTNWSVTLAGTSTVNREATDKHNGTYAARFDIDALGSTASLYSGSGSMVAGTRYRFSAWIKTAVGKSVAITLSDSASQYLTSGGTWSDTWDLLYFGETAGAWKQFIIDFIAESTGGCGINLMGITQTAGSSAYFDDISIVPLTDAGLEALPGRVTDIIRGNHAQAYGLVIPEVPAHGYCKEMLTDGGLEAWTSATDLTSWAEEVAGTSTVNRESSVKRRGSYACRMDIDSSNNGALINQTTGVTLKAGVPYLIKVWYRHDQGKSARIIFRDSGSTQYLKSDGSWSAVFDHIILPEAASWAPFTIRLVPTVEAFYVLYLGSNSAASSSIYFDDVSILEFQEASGSIIAEDMGWTFDGRDAYAQAPTSPIFMQSQMTLGCWFYDVAQPASYSTILMIGSGGSASQYSFMLHEMGSTATALSISNGSSEQTISTVMNWGSKKWHFLCGRVDGSYLRLYLDGVEATPVAQTVTPGGSNLPVTIGRELNSPGLAGSVAMPFICNRALSTQEIANIYNATKGFFSPRG